MPEYNPESTIIIPEGAPLMPEFFPDLTAPAEIEVKPAPPWGTIALFLAGTFIVGKVFKMF
jgi:hypothetical protein